MIGKSFLDTNILVYAYDQSDPGKQATAQAILTEGIEQDRVVLSVQVLGEFFNVVTRKIENPMKPDEAQSLIATFGILPVQEIDYPMVQRAIDIHQRYRISYWDSLIIAAAERAGCREIFSEDLNTVQTYNGITVRNPF